MKLFVFIFSEFDKTLYLINILYNYIFIVVNNINYRQLMRF